MNLSPEELRIELAKLRGWTKIKKRASILDYPWLSGINPNPDKITLVVPTDGSAPREPVASDYGFETLPDYLGDLNVMHREWLVLSDWKRRAFAQYLWAKVVDDGCTPENPVASINNATAAQRAYALYLTIKPQ